MAVKRKYPVGIRSFESIRQDEYTYTLTSPPLIYKMVTEGKPYLLSRPRHFGKSLISTLQAVFEGRRELFEAFTTEQGIAFSSAERTHHRRKAKATND